MSKFEGAVECLATWESLMPNEYVSSIHDIDLGALWTSGKRLILTDLDNTLVPWNDELVPDDLVTWLNDAGDMGFKVCIVSNNKSGRVEIFSRLSGIPAIGAAQKPKPIGFRKALSRFGMEPEQTIMVGDQLFTDIRGGNRMGLYTILVLPIHPKEWWGTRLVRNAERIAFLGLKKRGLKRPPVTRR